MRAIVFVGLGLLLGCDDSAMTSDNDLSMGGQDLAAGADLKGPLSKCGHPGDTGNAFGVGKFCTSLDDCGDTTKARLCSFLANGPTPTADDTYFCTFSCVQGSATCGDYAACRCDPRGCVCVPNSCASGDAGL